jgi:hypothetical protein
VNLLNLLLPKIPMVSTYKKGKDMILELSQLEKYKDDESIYLSKNYDLVLELVNSIVRTGSTISEDQQDILCDSLHMLFSARRLNGMQNEFIIRFLPLLKDIILYFEFESVVFSFLLSLTTERKIIASQYILKNTNLTEHEQDSLVITLDYCLKT